MAESSKQQSRSDEGKPAWWHMLDRAFKMMEMSGYRVAEHNPDHNNPIVAWMADARVLLQSVPEGAALSERGLLPPAEKIMHIDCSYSGVGGNADVTPFVTVLFASGDFDGRDAFAKAIGYPLPNERPETHQGEKHG